MNILLLTLIVVLVILVCYSIHHRDYYGQDASIRASVGWIAGPMYGYDPIGQFAKQIEEMKEKRGY